MKIRYDIKANHKKLKEETEGISEKFRIIHFDDYVVFEFFDVNSISSGDCNEQGEFIEETKSISYEVLDDETNLYKDYTTEMKSTISTLDDIISNHPTPDPDPDLTESERIDRLEQIILEQEGVI